MPRAFMTAFRGMSMSMSIFTVPQIRYWL